MKTFLRRHLVLAAVTVGMIVGAFIGWYQLGDFQPAAMRLRFAILGAGLLGGFVLALRLLALLVTIDPAKPRRLPHQNRRTSGYGPPGTDRP